MWKRIGKFISKPTYEYISNDSYTNRTVRTNDMPMVELMTDDNEDGECLNTETVQLLDA